MSAPVVPNMMPYVFLQTVVRDEDRIGGNRFSGGRCCLPRLPAIPSAAHRRNKRPAILGLRHGLAVGDEHLQMFDGFGDVDVQARRGSGGGTGAAFDEREDVLFLDLRAESRMRHVIEMFRDDLDRAGTPAKCFWISRSRAAGTGRA